MDGFVQVSSLLTLDIFHTLFCFLCWLLITGYGVKSRHGSIITRVIYPASRLQLSCEQTSNIFCSVREVDGLPLFIRRSICEKGT